MLQLSQIFPAVTALGFTDDPDEDDEAWDLFFQDPAPCQRWGQW